MRDVRWLAAVLLALALFAPEAAGAAGLKNENLLATVPTGFKVGYAANNDRGNFTEFVPKAESVENWSKMITVHTDYHLQVAPDVYAKTLGKGWKKSCPGGVANKVTSGKENGYPFAVWLYICPLNPQTGKPETMTLKAVRGNDSFYQVQYASRTEADAQVVQMQAGYLRAVSVCDTRKPQQACPPGM